MNWQTVIISEFNRKNDDGIPLTSLISDLFSQQTAHWQRLRENIHQRTLMETKTIALGQFAVQVQHNPARMPSTTAQVDSVSIQQRPCKLCPEQLFPEQKGVAYGDELVILCNPFPILDRHLSIVHRNHVPQAISGRLPLLLDLAQDLADEFLLFYNGPRCGASAPDHFHVQACARESLPVLQHCDFIERDPIFQKYKETIRRDDELEVFTLKDYHVRLLVYAGTSRNRLVAGVEHTLQNLAALTGGLEEPLINLLVTFEDPVWRIFLFPRAKHRPQSYYDGTLTLSPASLDLAGFLVIPVEEHFQAIRTEQIKQVYAEVSLESGRFNRLIKKMTS